MSAHHATEMAEKALNIAWDGNLPVDPQAIASRLLVTRTQDGKQSRHPIVMKGLHAGALDNPKLSGYAAFETQHGGNNFYLCVYNASEAQVRQRFTQAHELGHVVLGHVKPDGQPIKRDTEFNPFSGDPDEIDANAFAAALIMPARYVRHLARKYDDIAYLARQFGVSPTAMRYRLKNLGLL